MPPPAPPPLKETLPCVMMKQAALGGPSRDETLPLRKKTKQVLSFILGSSRFYPACFYYLYVNAPRVLRLRIYDGMISECQIDPAEH